MTAALAPREARALWLALASMAAGVALLVAASAPASSPLRASSRQLTVSGAPLMSAIVPLIFLFFLIPGLVYGYAAGTFTSHRDVMDGMSKTMSTMAYYLVMAFFAAQFINLFNRSNLPYSVTFLVAWTLFLLAYWQFGLPLGLDAPYVYP